MTKEAMHDNAEKLGAFARKNWAVLLILAAGLLLMLSGGGGDEPTVQMQAVSQAEKAADDVRTLAQTEAQLAGMLSSIEGAGAVRVMLSLETQDETVYAADVSQTETSVVLITAGSQKQQAVVSSVNCARYRGAVVLAQGADSPTVRLMITQAVSALTGLGADSISVLKMK